jgi:cytochrome c biogenesis protein CcmG, thiol:disulfide interchange protein DsbE
MSRLGDRAKAILFLLGGLSIGVLMGILVFAGGPVLSDPNRPRSQPPMVGSAAPDFAINSTSAEIIRLSDFKGRPVVINFWATWCTPCREEMPLFEKYAQKTEGRLVWLGVNEEEGIEIVTQFVQELELSFPILLDSDGRAAQSYYVRSFPATFFVDAEGMLRAQHLGQLSEGLLLRYLETIGVIP